MLPALPTPTSAASVQAALRRLAGGLLPERFAVADPWRRGAPLGWLRQGWGAIRRRLGGVVDRLVPLASLQRLVASLLLVVVLTGCGANAQPPRRVVLDALTLQIRLTQDQVAQALRLQPGGLPEVSRVRVEQQQPIAIGDARGLRLTGRFDWRLAEDPIRVDSPFEIVLQRGERGQSWRLARPLADAQDGEQIWITEPLPLPGARGARPAATPASGSGGAG